MESKMIHHSTGSAELDKVLGGGLVLGNLLLLAGDQGAGKTTLLLQACAGFARSKRGACFVSGEMTSQLLVQYTRRLGVVDNSHVSLFGHPEGLDLDETFRDAFETKSKLLVVDSLQVCLLEGAETGSVRAVRAAIRQLSKFAREKRVAVVAVCHLNRAGEFADGAGKMSHLLDGVVRFESRCSYGEDGRVIAGTGGLREISIEKSRQGRSDVTALVEMDETGRIGPLSPAAVRVLAKLV